MVFIYKDFTPYEKHLKAKEDRRLREWKRDKIAMNEYRRMKEKEYQSWKFITLKNILWNRKYRKKLDWIWKCHLFD